MRILTVAFAMACLFIAWSNQAIAAMPVTATSGWHAWTIDEDVKSTVSMCCFTMSGGKTTPTVCDLDGRSSSYSGRNQCAESSGRARVYARVANSALVEILVLDSSCSVNTSTEIFDHGLVNSDDNIAWFRSVIESGSRIREDALFWLVQTESDAGFAYLDKLLMSQ